MTFKKLKFIVLNTVIGAGALAIVCGVMALVARYPWSFIVGLLGLISFYTGLLVRAGYRAWWADSKEQKR